MIDEITARLRKLPVLEQIYPNDLMFNASGLPFYLETGMSALRIIWTASLARVGYIHGERPLSTILDFGCGFGRVTRWLRAAYPKAAITATDINAQAGIWCSEQFQTINTENPLTDQTYDLIWLGSVFTHLAPDTIEELLPQLTGALRPNGMLVFTAQGRFSCANIEKDGSESVFKAVAMDKLNVAIKAYEADGFGFVEYKPNTHYGLALTSPQWFMKHFEQRTDFIQILYQEKAWGNFQDAYAFLKAPLLERARSRI